MRVLCIEDNDDNLFVLYRRLTRAGFEVTVVTDGAQGVDTAIASPPDLILMDLNLPGLDGWEATRRLKSRPETKSVPIIAVSAHAAAGHRERARAAGCDDFESKPIAFEGLIAKIRALLDRGAPA